MYLRMLKSRKKKFFKNARDIPEWIREDKRLKIRTATTNDLEMIAAVEAECFPPAEAATKEEFAKRLQLLQ